MRDVAVIGIGLKPFGELWEKSLRDIFVESALIAMDDTGLDHLDSMYVGCMASGLFVGQEHIAALLADYLGCGPIPSTRVESACASGALAVKCAFAEVASGMSDIVLAGGVEKMTDVDTDEATYALSSASDQEYEGFHGVTFPALYAMIARAHMERYGTTREQLAQVAVKNHSNGSKNPNAQFRRPITMQMALKGAMVADPLRLFDCSPISDGAAAVILCPLDMAKSLSDKPAVKIIGVGQATDSFALCQREDITEFAATRRAAAAAYEMACKNPEDIDLAEVHDCFTISEICLIEALGFVEKGKGGPATEAGETALDGRIPVNTSGGLKAKGHPVGATGVAQVCEVVCQLRGEAGERQIQGPRVALAQNMGGSGASAVVTILEAR